MSADNAIYYRQVGDHWFVLYGWASNDYSNCDFVNGGVAFDTLSEALSYASKCAEDYAILEYGIVHSPAPHPLPPSGSMNTCACGSPANPNPDCERCQLVAEIARLKELVGIAERLAWESSELGGQSWREFESWKAKGEA